MLNSRYIVGHKDEFMMHFDGDPVTFASEAEARSYMDLMKRDRPGAMPAKFKPMEQVLTTSKELSAPK